MSIFTSSLTSFHWMKVTGLVGLLDSGGDLSVKTLLLSFLDDTATTTNIEGDLLTFSVWPRLAISVMFNKLKRKNIRRLTFQKNYIPPRQSFTSTVNVLRGFLLPELCRKSPWRLCIFLVRTHRTLSCEAGDRSQYSQIFFSL